MKKATADDSPAFSPPITSWSASELIGTDERWGELWLTNLTSGASVVPSVNGDTFFAEITALSGQTNTLHVAIRDRAGNMGYAVKDYWVGTIGATNATQNYAYDAAGCLTNLNGMALDWDERYRLVSANSATSSVSYAYDVLGRRVSRIEGSSTNYFVYAGNQVVADLDGSGTLIRSYVWGPGIDNLLALTDHATSNTYYVIRDHQNSVLALVDDSGSVVESYEYDAWGNVQVYSSTGQPINSSTVGNRYLFQGREYDSDTSLYFFRARWYDPETGRWLSKDPIGISGGFNLYAFCGNDPVNFVDPDGTDAKSILAAAWLWFEGVVRSVNMELGSAVVRFQPKGKAIATQIVKKVGPKGTAAIGGILALAMEPTAIAADPTPELFIFQSDEGLIVYQADWNFSRFVWDLEKRVCQ